MKRLLSLIGSIGRLMTALGARAADNLVRVAVLPLIALHQQQLFLGMRKCELMQSNTAGMSSILRYLLVFSLAAIQVAWAADSNPMGLALLSAVQNGDAVKATELLNQGASANTSDAFGRTVLSVATKSGNLPIVQQLLDRGSRVDRLSSGTWIACDAAASGNLEVMEAVLKAGAKLSVTNLNGFENTPMGMAAAYGHIDMVRFLLSKGVSVADYVGLEFQYKRQFTALTMAACEGHHELVRFLLANGAKVDQTNNVGETALVEVARRPQIETLKVLISGGANVNHRGSKGHTALIVSAFNGLEDSVRALLDAGANPHFLAYDQPDQPYDAEDTARISGRADLVSLIAAAKKRTKPPSSTSP